MDGKVVSHKTATGMHIDKDQNLFIKRDKLETLAVYAHGQWASVVKLLTENV